MQSVTFLTSYLTAAMLTFGFLLMSYDRYITQHELAEEQIIQSEARLNEAQKLAKIGSWEFDLQTNELTWSKEQYHIFEMEETPADKLYELCRTKIHPDDIPQMDEAIRIGREKGEGVIYEHRVICKDGSIKHLLGKGEVFKSTDGKRNMLRGTVQDVTERKLAEESLHIITQRLKQATEGAKIGVWDFDVVNNVLIWEESMFSLYGIKREDFTGEYNAWESVIHPDDVDAANEEVLAAIRGESEFDTGFRVIWPDQSVHYIKARATVLRDKTGKATRMVGINWDITDSKKAEESVIKSEKSLNDAQKLAKVGNWELNLNTMEQTWSREHYRIFELEETPADELYEAYRSKIHPGDVETLDKIVSDGINKGGSFVFEHRVVCNDGSIKFVIGKGETHMDSDGKNKIMRGTVQDVTEQKKAAETNSKYAILQSKSKEMEQFAYIASHDLREPLLTIKNYAELFEEEYTGKLDEDATEYLKRISRASSRMDELIKGLLDYSRLSKVKELQQVDCNKIMSEVLADLNLQLQNSEAKIEVKPLPVLSAYPLEMKQLFQNLLSNAIKFRKKETIPQICISAETLKGVWTFQFSDNGIGIEEADKEKIFSLFQQVHNRNEYAGSGIGLAYCKKIVELHHGNIWVESVPEKGSSFYFTILT
jgi:PAS domain S-box-containing protein